IYAYNHHVRLLSPEPEVVKQPQFTRVEEPTLLCNQVLTSTRLQDFSIPDVLLTPTPLGASLR
ncbi:MAG: hypothetical protein WBL50_19020, partial [Candidatus Acidiferrum sp.]